MTKGQIYYYYYGKDWPMFSMALVRFTDKYENKDDYYFWLVPGLDSFSCSHKGPYGDIVSSWKRENGMIRYDVTIPPNLNARVQQLTAGTHTFTGDFFKARIDHEK